MMPLADQSVPTLQHAQAIRAGISLTHPELLQSFSEPPSVKTNQSDRRQFSEIADKIAAACGTGNQKEFFCLIKKIRKLAKELDPKLDRKCIASMIGVSMATYMVWLSETRAPHFGTPAIVYYSLKHLGGEPGYDTKIAEVMEFSPKNLRDLIYQVGINELSIETGISNNTLYRWSRDEKPNVTQIPLRLMEVLSNPNLVMPRLLLEEQHSIAPTKPVTAKLKSKRIKPRMVHVFSANAIERDIAHTWRSVRPGFTPVLFTLPGNCGADKIKTAISDYTTNISRTFDSSQVSHDNQPSYNNNSAVGQVIQFINQMPAERLAFVAVFASPKKFKMAKYALSVKPGIHSHPILV